MRDGYRCQYCSDRFHTPDLSLDHVEPRHLCLNWQLKQANLSLGRCIQRGPHSYPAHWNLIDLKKEEQPGETMKIDPILDQAQHASLYICVIKLRLF